MSADRPGPGARAADEILQDVFLSHAGADKAAYVEPLAVALAGRSVSFWLDSPVDCRRSHNRSANDQGCDRLVVAVARVLRVTRFVGVRRNEFQARPW